MRTEKEIIAIIEFIEFIERNNQTEANQAALHVLDWVLSEKP